MGLVLRLPSPQAQAGTSTPTHACYCAAHGMHTCCANAVPGTMESLLEEHVAARRAGSILNANDRNLVPVGTFFVKSKPKNNLRSHRHPSGRLGSVRFTFFPASVFFCFFKVLVFYIGSSRNVRTVWFSYGYYKSVLYFRT